MRDGKWNEENTNMPDEAITIAVRYVCVGMNGIGRARKKMALQATSEQNAMGQSYAGVSISVSIRRPHMVKAIKPRIRNKCACLNSNS